MATRQIVRYRTCDKCAPKDVNAAVTDKLMFNGVKYDIDLCEEHSLELFSAIMAWTDLGTKVGESEFDQQVVAGEVLHDGATGVTAAFSESGRLVCEVRVNPPASRSLVRMAGRLRRSGPPR